MTTNIMQAASNSPIVTPTFIIARYDAASASPVVFLTDTIHGSHIKAWHGGKDMIDTTLDYYRTTKQLSPQDENVMRERFATAFKGTMPILRQRIPEALSMLSRFWSKGAIPRLSLLCNLSSLNVVDVSLTS